MRWWFGVGCRLSATARCISAVDDTLLGPFGFSVQCCAGLTVEQLAAACPNKTVGFTTVGQIRIIGYEK